MADGAFFAVRDAQGSNLCPQFAIGFRHRWRSSEPFAHWACASLSPAANAPLGHRSAPAPPRCQRRAKKAKATEDNVLSLVHFPCAGWDDCAGVWSDSGAILPLRPVVSARSRGMTGRGCASGRPPSPRISPRSSSGIANASCFVLYFSCRRCSFRQALCSSSAITGFASSCTSFFPLSNMYCSSARCRSFVQGYASFSCSPVV